MEENALMGKERMCSSYEIGGRAGWREGGERGGDGTGCERGRVLAS